MPFLAQKIMGILVFVVQKLSEVPDDPIEPKNDASAQNGTQLEVYKASINKNALAEKIRRKNIFKAKIQSITKVNKMFGILSSERENILKIKASAHDGKLPQGLLSSSPSGSTKNEIRDYIKQFSKALEADA